MEKYQNVFLPYSFKVDVNGKVSRTQDKKVYELYASLVDSGFVNVDYDRHGEISTRRPKI